MAETIVNPEVFEAVCVAEEENRCGNPAAALARITVAFDNLIYQGYDFEEAKETLRLADQQLRDCEEDLNRGLNG